MTLLSSIGDLPALGKVKMFQALDAQKTEALLNPDLAWIRDMPDELEVYIAHREFDKAVQCINRGTWCYQSIFFLFLFSVFILMSCYVRY